MTNPKRIDWPSLAAELATLVPRAQLHPRVLAWADGAGSRRDWGVAFSGGADSLGLLLLVWAHWPECRRRLFALHFNHRMRGRESLADARFCARVCASLGIKIRSGIWEEMRPDASEAQLRAVRMTFFEREARVVWLGHQQDDIAESMLMRMARGSGSGGLAAPRPVQSLPRGRVHLRPLLTIKKKDLVRGLRAVGAPWCDDATNRSGAYYRNRVRASVLPAWSRAARRDALAGAALARELLEEDDAALEARVDELCALGRNKPLPLRTIAGQPRAIVRRALHRWLLAQSRAGTLVRQGFESLLRAVERGNPTRLSLGREGFAVIRNGVLGFERAEK